MKALSSSYGWIMEVKGQERGRKTRVKENIYDPLSPAIELDLLRIEVHWLFHFHYPTAHWLREVDSAKNTNDTLLNIRGKW
jgi:hypothetical protein